MMHDPHSILHQNQKLRHCGRYDNMPVYPGALRIADDTGAIDKRCGLTRYSCQRLAVGAPGRVLGTA
jgi:hypothetical protein